MNAYGDIRWRLDYRTHPDLKNADHQDEINRLRTGNFFFGDSGPSVLPIYEVDLPGNVGDN